MPTTPARGLAIAAVGALAATGLAMTVVPTAQAAGPGVTLLSQRTGFASVRIDHDFTGDQFGTRLTARLAAAPTPGTDVRFQVNTDPEAADNDPAWADLDLDDESTNGSIYSGTWYGYGPRGYLGGERVALRVAATDAGGTTYSTRRNVEVTDDESTVDSLELDDSLTGYFTQPYAGSGRTATTIPVTGTTSASTGTVALSSWRTATGTFSGTTAADVEEEQFKLPTGTAVPGGRFNELIDITGFSPADGAVAVSAVRGSDDVASIPLQAQTIDSIDVDAPPVRAGETGTVTLRVLDQDGDGVIGAEVRRGSNVLVGYTGADGLLETTQAVGPAQTYYVNTTDVDAYEPSTDVETGPVEVETYVPAPTYIQTVLTDGEIFDVDEYAAGDIAVDVYDQQDRLVGAGTSVSYKLFPSGEAEPASYSTATTNAAGQAVIPFATAGASGEYRLITVLTSDAGDPNAAGNTYFRTGQATLVLNPRATPVAAPAGGQVDYVGRLTIAGEPLPARRVDLTYRRGTEVVPGNQADAGIVVPAGRALRNTVVTNGNGSFRVTVDDAAERPQASEKGGVLTGATGNTVATDDASFTGNAGARIASTVNFGTAGPGRAAIALGGKNNGKKADVLSVTGPTSLAGETVKIFRLKNGKRVLVTSRKLNATGDVKGIKVKDRNKGKKTTYVATLNGSPRVLAATSNKRSLS